MEELSGDSCGIFPGPGPAMQVRLRARAAQAVFLRSILCSPQGVSSLLRGSHSPLDFLTPSKLPPSVGLHSFSFHKSVKSFFTLKYVIISIQLCLFSSTFSPSCESGPQELLTFSPPGPPHSYLAATALTGAADGTPRVPWPNPTPFPGWHPV